jgi:hypothetical protein
MSPLYTRSVSARTLLHLVELEGLWSQPLRLACHEKGSPLTSLVLKANFSSLLADLIIEAALLSIGQLLTLHHQRRIRAPAFLPESFVPLFQWRQPWRASVHSVP